MKKPTMQDIADAAGVSRVTVWKVLNNYPGVSEAMHYQIVSEGIRLGYPLPDHIKLPVIQKTAIAKEAAASEPSIISVVVSRPDSSIFWINIIHQIAKEISKSNCSLMYTYVPTIIPQEYMLPPQVTNDNIQGIIVLNIYDARLLSMLNQLSVPKVFLDSVSSFPLDTLTGDLILLEGKNTTEKITDSLFSKKHHQIGFIGDIHYALTNKFRYEGYLTSMKNHHAEVVPIYCNTDTIGVETYMEELSDYLDSLPRMPDAFVCASDYVAHVVYQYLMQNDYRVPEDVELTGFDNVADYIELKDQITTVDVDTNALGKRLIAQLLYRMDNPDAPLEITYVKSEIIYRNKSI